MSDNKYSTRDHLRTSPHTPVPGLKVVPLGLHKDGGRAGDLRGADLTGVDLSGVDLSGADMCWAHLVGADLRHVRLVAIRMEGARYDSTTQWPDGFDPEYFGAVRLD